MQELRKRCRPGQIARHPRASSETDISRSSFITRARKLRGEDECQGKGRCGLETGGSSGSLPFSGLVWSKDTLIKGVRELEVTGRES